MQVRELVAVGEFFKKFVHEHSLTDKYKQLIDAVNQAAQNTNPEAVKKKFDELIDLHRMAEREVLSPAQRKLAEDYGAGNLLGAQAAERLREIFETHQAHPQGLTSALQKMQNETNQMENRATKLIEVLDPMLGELDREDLGDDEGRLWLYFASAASVETIDELEIAAETWKEILHHFSRMPGAEAGAGRLLQINKSSPLEIEIAANVAVLLPLALGIQWVLGRIEHVIKILQERERLKALKLNNKIIESVEAEAQALREQIATEAAAQLKDRFKADNEARNAAEVALRKIVKFVEDGGELDIDVGEGVSEEDEEEQPNREELKSLIKTIRENIKLLPPADEVDEDEDG